MDFNKGIHYKLILLIFIFVSNHSFSAQSSPIREKKHVNKSNKVHGSTNVLRDHKNKQRERPNKIRTISNLSVREPKKDEVKIFYKACKDGNKKVIISMVNTVKGILGQRPNKDDVDASSTPILTLIRYWNKPSKDRLACLKILAGNDRSYVKWVDNSYISGRTPLHAASDRGLIDCINSLIDLGANPNAKDANLKTPLMYAIQSKENKRNKKTLDVCKTLVGRGANILDKDSKLKTVYTYVEENNFEGGVRYMNDVGNKINNWFVAIKEMNVEAIKKAYKGLRFATMYKSDMRNDTALGLVINNWSKDREEECIKCVEFLLSKDKSLLEVENAEKKCPIHIAARNLNKKAVEVLIDKGDNVNRISGDYISKLENSGFTPLIEVVNLCRGDDEICGMVEFLVGKGANIYIRTKEDDKDAYEYASEFYLKKTLKYLYSIDQSSKRIYNDVDGDKEDDDGGNVQYVQMKVASNITAGGLNDNQYCYSDDEKEDTYGGLSSLDITFNKVKGKLFEVFRGGNKRDAVVIVGRIPYLEYINLKENNIEKSVVFSPLDKMKSGDIEKEKIDYLDRVNGFITTTCGLKNYSMTLMEDFPILPNIFFSDNPKELVYIVLHSPDKMLELGLGVKIDRFSTENDYGFSSISDKVTNEEGKLLEMLYKQCNVLYSFTNQVLVKLFNYKKIFIFHDCSTMLLRNGDMLGTTNNYKEDRLNNLKKGYHRLEELTAIMHLDTMFYSLSGIIYSWNAKEVNKNVHFVLFYRDVEIKLNKDYLSMVGGSSKNGNLHVLHTLLARWFGAEEKVNRQEVDIKKEYNKHFITMFYPFFASYVMKDKDIKYLNSKYIVNLHPLPKEHNQLSIVSFDDIWKDSVKVNGIFKYISAIVNSTNINPYIFNLHRAMQVNFINRYPVDFSYLEDESGSAQIGFLNRFENFTDYVKVNDILFHKYVYNSDDKTMLTALNGLKKRDREQIMGFFQELLKYNRNVIEKVGDLESKSSFNKKFVVPYVTVNKDKMQQLNEINDKQKLQQNEMNDFVDDFMSAIGRGSISAVKSLYNTYGENILYAVGNSASKENALHYACLAEKTGMIELLLSFNGGDKLMKMENKKGLTPMHFAVVNRKVQSIKTLIKKGDDVNKVNSLGNTPLHEIANDSSDVIDDQAESYLNFLVFQCGADIYKKNSDGCTVHRLAVYNKFTNLESHISSIDKKISERKDKNVNLKNGFTSLCFFACLGLVILAVVVNMGDENASSLTTKKIKYNVNVNEKGNKGYIIKNKKYKNVNQPYEAWPSWLGIMLFILLLIALSFYLVRKR